MEPQSPKTPLSSTTPTPSTPPPAGSSSSGASDSLQSRLEADARELDEHARDCGLTVMEESQDGFLSGGFVATFVPHRRDQAERPNASPPDSPPAK